MVTVAQAEALVNAQVRDYGTQQAVYSSCCGRVLAKGIYADRDFPPFNRATVDGIGITYQAWVAGRRTYDIRATQAAGASPCGVTNSEQCIEIMTGAAIDPSIDTIIRYEDIDIDEESKSATVKKVQVKKGQNIHRQGSDHSKGDEMAGANTLVTPGIIGLAASTGQQKLWIKKLPRVAIITTGDELVSIDQEPNPFQLRRSNGVTVSSVLERYGIQPDTLHLEDDYGVIQRELSRCLETFDVIILCGGVSMGKFDYVPKVLASLGASAHFQKVKQKPGKPFWFGTYADQALIFAFPGNPVSVFLCLHRYFFPWLHKTLGLGSPSAEYALLAHDLVIPFKMQYFAQVKLTSNDQGQLWASSVNGNGSGDFSTLARTDAFMELPLDRDEFQAGQACRIWRYIQ